MNTAFVRSAQAQSCTLVPIACALLLMVLMFSPASAEIRLTDKLSKNAQTAPMTRLVQSCGCPSDAPKCVNNNMRNNEVICCSSDAISCVSPKATWCCASTSGCLGDNGGCR